MDYQRICWEHKNAGHENSEQKISETCEGWKVQEYKKKNTTAVETTETVAQIAGMVKGLMFSVLRFLVNFPKN